MINFDDNRYYPTIEQEAEFIDDMHRILTRGNTWLYCQCDPVWSAERLMPHPLRWDDYQMVTDAHIQMEYICDNSECPIEVHTFVVRIPPQHLQGDEEE
tara:strand:+ start:2253 stop:2549 length:297 start_codon:yes stop_codon:yes gene_type:complete